ncbi:hypothetical protein HHK36_001317 [Tetracentron sinense]|uniref:Longin domain-containing protein n=1 Tax=Tetracentron sinense TaxID=13715 RepID=A0A835DR24_TETSI|nr:hypothetical protein HHK36_001317 [Tetracentron sinense]
MFNLPNLILYACVSKGTTVLTELSSGDGDLETLALQCLENTPPFHAMLSHTVRKRTYNILMEDHFVYFAIHDEDLGKPQGFWFLERLKDAFTKILKSKPFNDLDNLASHCFHEEFSPVFRTERMLYQLKAKKKLSKEMNGGSKDIPMENKVDVSDDASLSRELSMSSQKNGFCIGNEGCQESQEIWWQRVRTLFLLDLFICIALFSVWLLICRGFKCING